MKATVLLVDDDPLDIRPLRHLLESWDLAVVAARSGAEASRDRAAQYRARRAVAGSRVLSGRSSSEAAASARPDDSAFAGSPPPGNASAGGGGTFAS